MAFDKCTLLSSQGSDAPPTQSSQPGPKGNFSILPAPFSLSNRHAEVLGTRSAARALGYEATSLAYPFRGGCQIDAFPVGSSTSDRSPSAICSEELIGGGGSPLEGGKALGLSASLWGEQVITYVDADASANLGEPPGVSRLPRPRMAKGPRAMLGALSGDAWLWT